MQPLLKRVQHLRDEVTDAWQRLALDEKQQDLKDVDEKLADSAVWNDSDRAQQLSKQSAALRSQIEPWQSLQVQLVEIEELLSLDDDSLVSECEEQITVLEKQHEVISQDLC